MSESKAQALANQILNEAFGEDAQAKAIPWEMIIEIVMDLIANCGEGAAAQRAVQPTWRDRVRLGAAFRADGFRWRDRRKMVDAAFKVAAEAGETEVEAAMKEIKDLD